MKKLLIIMTLFMSSFFLFCRNEVKADMRKITDSDIETYITEDFLLAREKIIARGWKYIFFYNAGDYKVFVFPSYSTLTLNSNQFKVTGVTWFRWRDSALSEVISNYSYTFAYYDVTILDCSDDIYPTSSFSVTYNDITYSATTDKKMITVYDIYNEINNVPEENPHQEEIDKVTNFYTMVIEKIEYLANEISNNYILLFIIGIFIVTFVFLLIFRRFL